jgi:S1-C subfamily serine protease
LAGTAAAQGPDGDPFVAAVARVRPAVLAVGTYCLQDAPAARYVGTGFVIDDGRTVVTNAHNVEAVRQQDRLAHMAVYAPDSRPSDGRRVAVTAEDRFHDIALLRFEGPPLPALMVDAQTVPRQGQAVGIVGYPIGMSLGVVPAAHKGVVAAVVPAVRPLPEGAVLTPELARAIREPYLLYQLDLVVFPGNSGSPMFDADSGVVLGVINKTLATRTREHLLTDPSGIAYAVEARWVHQLLLRSRSERNAESPSTAGAPEAGKPLESKR